VLASAMLIWVLDGRYPSDPNGSVIPTPSSCDADLNPGSQTNGNGSKGEENVLQSQQSRATIDLRRKLWMWSRMRRDHDDVVCSDKSKTSQESKSWFTGEEEWSEIKWTVSHENGDRISLLQSYTSSN
jgi:hypothetical protein